MLDSSLRSQLHTYLGHLTRPVQLTANLDDGQTSRDVRALLADIASCSPLISIQYERVSKSAPRTRCPQFSVHEPGQAPRITFAGLPLGHEFTSLVLALLHVGGHPPKVGPETLDQIAALDRELLFETFYSQSCQNCPDVVQALNLLAARNPRIRHVAVDGSAFRAEVEERRIMAVPTVYLNGERFGQGRMELEEILRQLDAGVRERSAAALGDKAPFDMLVVGSGPAGAAAAIYAARKGIRTGLLADRFGGQVADTLGIENFISVTATEGPKLVAALEEHVKSYPVDVMKHERATALRILPERLLPSQGASSDARFEVELAGGAALRARSVVIATGARWRNLGVPGEDEYRTRGVTYCPHCDGPLFKDKPVAVIGGGNSGVEAAIDLAGIVGHVTLLEFAESLKADDILIRKLRSLNNVTVVLSAHTTEVLGDGTRVTGLRYQERTTGESKQLELTGIFVQIGLLPNTDWVKETVSLSPHGEIVVDDRGQTNVPGVFAAGDVTTTPFKQIIIASGEGAKAALGAFDYLIRHSAPAA